MTGQDFQDKLDAIVVDLQTKGKGQAIGILARNPNNSTRTFIVSSDEFGVVDAGQVATVQAFIDAMKAAADTYETERVPVSSALEDFKLASAPHQVLSDAASLARKNYNDAVLADPVFQSAKTALDSARSNPSYITAIAEYTEKNVSENFGNLGDAKGKYLPL